MAELVAIDENLCRAELTAAERTAATKRRAEIWQTLHPNSGATCATIPERGRGRPQEFAADTAASTGRSKSQINRDLARAEALGSDLEAVRKVVRINKGANADSRGNLKRDGAKFQTVDACDNLIWERTDFAPGMPFAVQKP